MGTSLSGLTPATTFDGLLKTSDNEPLDGTLRTISDGSGVDSALQLSDSALQVNGDLNVGSVHKIYQDTTNLNIVGNSGSTSLKYFTNFGNNNTNQFGLNNFFRYQVGIGFTSPQSAATLNVKGSGATSATTSLLVQNSAGATALKINDDKGVFIYSGLKIFDKNVLDVSGSSIIRYYYQSGAGNHVFYTNSGTERMRLNDDGNLGIGETTPTARLHIKGSGNTNTTTSLLVQNSDGLDMLKILDDRSIETYDATGNVIAKNNADNRRFQINPDRTSVIDFEVDGGGLSNLIRTDSGLNSVGIGTVGLASTRLHVKGSGATSATTALLVQNSAGTDLLKVNDDGAILFEKYNLTSNAFYPIAGGNLGQSSVANRHFDDAFIKGYVHVTNNTTSSTTYDASAKLQVDSTTQGFLPPRMTTTQRDAINMVGDPAVSTPATGLIIYNTTTNKAQCYNGTTWNDLF